MTEQLKAKIDYLSSEIYDLMRIIEKGYEVINSIHREDLKTIYFEELKPFTHDYQEIKAELVEALEQYFLEEKKQSLPNDLTYRRLYRRLKE